jgi:hypothetical protein
LPVDSRVVFISTTNYYRSRTVLLGASIQEALTILLLQKFRDPALVLFDWT